MRICVYAIAKNEEGFVDRFCESAKDADLILIADTGSSDDTIEQTVASGARAERIHISPWRFDLARNAALALVPKDIDICVSLDLDETLEPGWREEIERIWRPETTRMRYMFDWSGGIKFFSEKIHSRDGYFWHHPCHEYPKPDGRITEVYAHTDKLLVTHKPDPSKSRGQYLDLLELSIKEDPRCPRNAFYYARELSFYRKWQESIDAVDRYLKMPEAVWSHERSYAHRVAGNCYAELGNNFMAEASYLRAAAEAPNMREPWCGLAMLNYRQSRWAECFSYAMRALSIKDRELVYTCDPETWGSHPHDLASVAAWNLGMKSDAIEQARLAVAANPSDSRLRENLQFVSEKAA